MVYSPIKIHDYQDNLTHFLRSQYTAVSIFLKLDVFLHLILGILHFSDYGNQTSTKDNEYKEWWSRQIILATAICYLALVFVIIFEFIDDKSEFNHLNIRSILNPRITNL